MTEIRYQAGATLFAEGDRSDYVLKIISGNVEVVKGVGGQSVALGQLGAGEFVGEMGVLEDRPRSASVRAASDVVVQQMDRDSFLALISSDGSTAFQLMVRLSERLAAIDRAYAESMAAAAPDRSVRFQAPLARATTVAGGRGALTVFAGSDGLGDTLPRDGHKIGELPFAVGRAAEPGKAAPAGRVQLVIPDSEPYRLSRLHFWIEHGQSGYIVRDRSSTLGTRVNGVSIGHHFARDHAELKPGENTIVAGGAGSPFVFRLVVEKAA
jgi:CRP-like cAMP-binding protein